jgi:hypothetical protein
MGPIEEAATAIREVVCALDALGTDRDVAIKRENLYCLLTPVRSESGIALVEVNDPDLYQTARAAQSVIESN